MPLEKLLKKDMPFLWMEEFQREFDEIKEELVIVQFLVFLDWMKEFHVHVGASFIVLGIVPTQPREGEIDLLIVFASRKLIKAEKNYTMTKREWIEMVYLCRSIIITC